MIHSLKPAAHLQRREAVRAGGGGLRDSPDERGAGRPAGGRVEERRRDARRPTRTRPPPSNPPPHTGVPECLPRCSEAPHDGPWMPLTTDGQPPPARPTAQRQLPRPRARPGARAPAAAANERRRRGSNRRPRGAARSYENPWSGAHAGGERASSSRRGRRCAVGSAVSAVNHAHAEAPAHAHSFILTSSGL
jgi:hypothetical protein